MATEIKDTTPRVWVAITQQSKAYVLAGLRGPVCRNPGQWNLFGGNIDKGESPQQAGVREVFEETGLVIDPADLKFAFSRMRKDAPVIWYTVRKSVLDLSRLKHTQEVVDYEYFSSTTIPTREIHYSLYEFFKWSTGRKT